MNNVRKLTIGIPAVVLVSLLITLYVTRGTMEQLSFLRRGGAVENGLVDQRPYQTAQTLAGMAVSAEEQTFAQEAERLADHEVDQAFALALRQAGLQQRVLTGQAAAMAARVEELKGEVKDDQAQVDQLTAAEKASGNGSTEGDDLDVAKAQLQLDSDELTDATGDLATESGDQRGKVQQELNAREAAMKKAEAASGEKKATAVTAVRQHGTLWGRSEAWFEQRGRAKLLGEAEARAREDAAKLTAQHDAMEKQSGKAGAAMSAAAGATRVKLLQAMATRRTIMSILDDRTQTQLQLATLYGRWQQQIWLQHHILGYLVLESMAWVAFLLLMTMLGVVVVRAAVRRMASETRQQHTLETVMSLAIEAVGLLAILLVVFGVPQQLTTILGLATAGLTVVFQDFILAFFGWFVLMGRNGIRVSDWVEINGVGGEVTEIGLFRTMLLETGNWTSRGHPTGRRVTFINSFAIRGQYFNFSTHGQWMWDEIQLNVAANANAYEVIGKMQEAVERETANDCGEAEREWHKATGAMGLSQFTAKPTVDLRPAASGVDVVVRFVTRASSRFEVRNRIFEMLVGLMDGTERPGLEGVKEGGTS